MHILKLAPVLMIATLVTACGDKPNPVGPNSPTAPPLASLVISGADYVLVAKWRLIVRGIGRQIGVDRE